MNTEGAVVIARIWKGWIATGDTQTYVDYITGTGLKEYRETPGNLGAQMLTREVITRSWWDSLDSIRAFAGDDIEAAVFYPDDDQYLVERETRVTHHEVHSAS